MGHVPTRPNVEPPVFFSEPTRSPQTGWPLATTLTQVWPDDWISDALRRDSRPSGLNIPMTSMLMRCWCGDRRITWHRVKVVGTFECARAVKSLWQPGTHFGWLGMNAKDRLIIDKRSVYCDIPQLLNSTSLYYYIHTVYVFYWHKYSYHIIVHSHTHPVPIFAVRCQMRNSPPVSGQCISFIQFVI